MLFRHLGLAGAAGALAPTDPVDPGDPDPPDPGTPVTVSMAWSGNVTTTAATVKARCADAASMTMKLSVQPDLSPFTSVVGTEGNDEVWTFSPTGLTANTQYYYGFVGSSVTGKFKTFPSGAASFTIAAASCAGHIPGTGLTPATSNANTFSKILARSPLAFIHMGDFHYRNISTNNVGLFRTAYQDVHANPNQGELYRNVPIAYTWDDHDFGADNSSSTSKSKPAAAQAYRDYVPHYPLDHATAVYQTFVIGRIRFIVLDCRSERVNATDVHLGAQQQEWLHDTLLAATEPCIVMVSSVPWTANSTDSWGGFVAERTALADFWQTHSLTSRMFIIHGDYHRLAYDLGTHSDFRTGGGTTGPHVACLAPLHASIASGLTTRFLHTYTTSQRMYGTMSFVDNGSSIVLTTKGWAVSDSGETEVFSFDSTFPG